MPRVTTSLTNTEVEKAKPKDKEYSLADGQGLFLRVRPSGSKTWLFNYIRPVLKKRNNLAIGSYPDISLKQARIFKEQYRALLARNIDPQSHRQAEKMAKQAEVNGTFARMVGNE